MASITRENTKGSSRINFNPIHPKRAGTATHARYEAYKSATTLHEARELGANSYDIKAAFETGTVERVELVPVQRFDADHHRDAPGPEKMKDGSFPSPMRDLSGERLSGDDDLDTPSQVAARHARLELI